MWNPYGSSRTFGSLRNLLDVSIIQYELHAVQIMNVSDI